MSFDVIIVGAGPGGLACAEITASQGLKTLVLERKKILGRKVCAGGITWNGLIKKVPNVLTERKFTEQFVFSRYQRACISSPTPIIATVNREKLGQQMAEKALNAGAQILLNCQVLSIKGNELTFLDKKCQKMVRQTFDYLVGADGSSSIVRRHLGIPIKNIGIGINYQLPGFFPDMEWHLDSTLFRSGYSWVFPHKETVSVGAYADARVMKAKKLQESLMKWSKKWGYPLSDYKGTAEYINFDYRGYQFKNIFLVGDAAGLASGLTGEGIYPAIISGETVARCITIPDYSPVNLQKMINNHVRHRKMVSILGTNHLSSFILSELVTFGLKTNLINFSVAEMAAH
ncbi:MAG: NAD(P)/FAD-dependent oxidoreductase [Desulforhopalus sp.]